MSKGETPEVSIKGFSLREVFFIDCLLRLVAENSQVLASKWLMSTGKKV